MNLNTFTGIPERIQENIPASPIRERVFALILRKDFMKIIQILCLTAIIIISGCDTVKSD